ncbi:hypothetical protein HAX54_021184 [Datura stramonium]|uniref:Uncharacterized protein n=1 Tax=Datura stramonium TaxID=4076 RepID=A0ABS8UTI0_DATST|nr:hypothetical protein [Datura stramonium]
MQREMSGYDDFYPDYEEETDSNDQHMEDFQAFTLVSNSGNWRCNIGSQGRNYYDRTSYDGKEPRNQINKGPLPSNSRDAKIEAIPNQILTKLESTESGLKQQKEQKSIVLKQKREEDQYIAVETRSGKTTIEIQAYGIRFTINESNPRPTETRE